MELDLRVGASDGECNLLSVAIKEVKLDTGCFLCGAMNSEGN